LIAGASDDVAVGGLRQVRYTEGYPYLLALAAVLWLASSPSRLPKASSLILLALLLPGCAQQVDENGETQFRARSRQGCELLSFAREQADVDALAERSLLVDAREEFLRAALLRPGHVATARQITTITRQLRDLETLIEQQRADEKQRREKLGETIRRLETLVVRQKRLSEQSRDVLSRRPEPTGADVNNPQYYDSTEEFLPQEELDQLAPPVRAEQQTVQERTESVLDSIKFQQETLRQILTQAYGNIGRQPATEIDPVVDLLAGAVAAQEQAAANLAPGAVRWPKANTALHTAAGQIEQALDAISSLQPPATDEDDNPMASRSAGDYDEDMDGLESESQDSASQPVSPGDFQEALSLQSLPIPDYTSAEIMAEEAANQQKRARQKAARAGAKVEKNW
ncbi:MAG TPA: hypothetical protein VE890_00475, partial [Thermoguttaceae bacterium]|nr:hypothetical protein [Thermoguttaceae bacterium]